MKKYILTSALFLTPAIAFAQFAGTKGLLTGLGDVVKQLTLLLAGIALLVFFWGIVKFISAAANEEAIAEGKRLMIWGLIALFVMVSVWGIVTFLQKEFGIQSGGIFQFQPPPTQQTTGQPTQAPCGDPALDPSLPPLTQPCR